MAPENAEGCAVQLNHASPEPEQPNQRSRVCDVIAHENSEGCAAQVSRVCDQVHPQEGCDCSLAPGVTHQGNPPEKN
eukprot:CAMPEP_0170479788 /NCGR_PEP_ID=MMETSP0208-20121228/886_1 /TAXON_ID=197538 /ORGANISM="Strombidium inclinatum, Strain S3" /LENGTH=76 /DNA_ID=CAMNT_0010752241 /DNA_START=117 /DNA_END=347 /DNA_ORIENTATION=+